MQETQVQSLVWEDPREEDMATHSDILAGEYHGQKSLVGYSPRGRKESDMTDKHNLICAHTHTNTAVIRANLTYSFEHLPHEENLET